MRREDLSKLADLVTNRVVAKLKKQRLVVPKEKTTQSPLVSKADAARLLGVHPETVRRLWNRGELKGRHVGNRVKITRKSIESYLRRVR